MNLRSLLRSFLLLLLSGALLFSLSACSKYRVEMSNTEQTRTMLTVGETEIAYEVVYFFYHTYLDAYPEESFATRMERVNKGICELYGIFEVSRAYKVDPYGEEVNDLLNDMVKEMIDQFPTRRDYIDRITENHMTDTVSRLLLRSYICQDILLTLIETELEKDSKKLSDFLEREDVIRVLSMTLDFGDQTEAMRRRAAEIMEALSTAADTDEAFLEIARRKATTENAHTYITTEQWHNLCDTVGEAPTIGTISEPLYDGTTCLIMRVSEKDLAYAKENPDKISISYLECAIREAATSLAGQLQPTEEFLTLTEESFQ